MYDAQDLVRECLQQRKSTGSSFHATALRLLQLGLVQGNPSVTAITDRLTVFKRNLAHMPPTLALMKVERFRKMGRPAILDEKHVKSLCARAVKEQGSTYGVVKRKLTRRLKEMGHERKLSSSTIWLYQQKVLASRPPTCVPLATCDPASVIASIQAGGATVLHLSLAYVHYDAMVVYLKDKEYR